jgi:BRCA1-associated protein
VWDYVGDNYVHRLIQSKTDGKLVELNSPNVHAYDCCGGCDCADSGVSEALLNSKVEAVMFTVLLRKGCNCFFYFFLINNLI